MARRRRARPGPYSSNPFIGSTYKQPHPWSEMEGTPIWRQRMIYGRDVRIENLRNYHLGYKYSPRLKRWVSPKTGRGARLNKLFARLMPSKRQWYRMRGIKVN